MALRRDRSRQSNQYTWNELCETEEELKKILSLPEIEREKLYDERVEKYNFTNTTKIK